MQLEGDKYKIDQIYLKWISIDLTKLYARDLRIHYKTTITI